MNQNINKIFCKMSLSILVNMINQKTQIKKIKIKDFYFIQRINIFHVIKFIILINLLTTKF